MAARLMGHKKHTKQGDYEMYFESTQRRRALTTYRERLARLAGNVGQRNASLLGLCNYGARAGLSDAQMECEIVGSSGTPPLTAPEVRRAIKKARLECHHVVCPRPRAVAWQSNRVPPHPLGSGAVSFVARMIEIGGGATFESLAAGSPVPISSGPSMQTAQFLSAMYDTLDFLFIAEKNHAGVLGKNVLSAQDWRRRAQRVSMPPLLIANPLTGYEGLTKEGKPSLRCSASIKRHRYALVEFDEMQLEEQYAFWAGVIKTGAFPLRSLVYSGGKSLHGLIEVDAPDRAQWDKQIEVLLYATHNPDAPKDRQADRACRNPDRMTRLAGAMRPESGALQRLLWLSTKQLGI
jgi:hypothetical protein